MDNLPEDRSLIVIEHLQKASQKFEYFIVSASMGLFAYVGEKYQPEKLGWSSNTVEVLAILLLLVSVFLGFKRIEQFVKALRINLDVLHWGQERGRYVSAKCKSGETVDLSTGNIITTKVMDDQIEILTHKLEKQTSETPVFDRAMERVLWWRNLFLVAGLLILFVAKVLSAYC